jgi:hypothetical protein
MCLTLRDAVTVLEHHQDWRAPAPATPAPGTTSAISDRAIGGSPDRTPDHTP